MNSRRRPRRRPRVRSVNFRVFCDLVFRVAAWNVLHPASRPDWGHAYAREFYDAPRFVLAARVYRQLEELPTRRYHT